jgi:hypothetical protein
MAWVLIATTANKGFMKKPPRAKATTGDLKPEYRLDYFKAKPNRFAARSKASAVVLLAPDVARVFPNGDAVNTALRAIIQAFPPTPRKSSPAKRRPSVA